MTAFGFTNISRSLLMNSEVTITCKQSVLTLATHCLCYECWNICHSPLLFWSTRVPRPKIRSRLKWNTPSSALQGQSVRSLYLHFMLPQKNTLQQEFKEMGNVYSVVLAQAVHCSLKNHLSEHAPPIHHQSVYREVRCFYKLPYITLSWCTMGI